MTGCVSIEKFQEPEQDDGVRLDFFEAVRYSSSAEALDASQIKDVNVFLFDGQGALVYRQFFTGCTVFMERLPVIAGEKYDVCVLANWGKEYETETGILMEDLCYEMENAGNIATGNFPEIFTGIEKGVEFPIVGNVLDLGLQRLYARIRLKCDFSLINSSVSLNVEKVSLKNVPDGVSLFVDNVASRVTDGAVLEGESLDLLKTEGIDFYMFENVQGVIGNTTSNKRKALLLTSEQREVCSYIELECNYLSRERNGKIIYRFYLGTDHTNCNVYRNSTQTVTVNFKGNASSNENSVSVDNSALGYRPTSIKVSPSAIKFSSYRQSTYGCTAEVLPAEAYDKRVIWSTTDPMVATVSQEGLVTTQGIGQCNIVVKCMDNPEVYSSIGITVNNYTGSN